MAPRELIRRNKTYHEHLHHFRCISLRHHPGRMAETFHEHEQILRSAIARDRMRATYLVKELLRMAARAYTSRNGAVEDAGG